MSKPPPLQTAFSDNTRTGIHKAVIKRTHLGSDFYKFMMVIVSKADSGSGLLL